MKREWERDDSNLAWWRWALPLLGFTLLVYVNSLSNGFVFDDLPLIQDNPQIRSIRDVAGIFGRQGYRPVRTLTYALNYWLFGLNPFYFHLTNVLAHGANGILLFLLLRRLFGKSLLALAGAALFVCHPIQTAAVAYVSGRKDVLAGGFVLAGMLCFANHLRDGKRFWFVGSLILFALALFSKEVAVIFPLLLFALESLNGNLASEVRDPARLRTRSLKVLVRRRWFYGSMLIAALVFLYYAQFIMYASRKADFWGGSPFNNYLTSLKLFLHYMRMTVVPYPLIADYEGVFPVASGIGDFSGWVAIAGTAAYLWAVVWSLRRRPRMGFGLLWFGVTLLPVLQLLPFHEIAADHYLYLPLAGFIVALLDAGEWKFARLPVSIAVSAAACLVLLFSGMSVSRNRDWRNTRSLWEATARHAPGSARVHNNLGTTLHAEGVLDEALAHLLRATELDPTAAAYWSNLGALYHDQGDYQAAVGALLRSVAIDPGNAYTQTNLGNAYKKLALNQARDAGHPFWRAALAHLERAVSLDTRNGALRYNLGSAYYELGRKQEARSHFEGARRLSPDFGRAYYALGLLDSEAGDFNAARVELQRAIELEAGNLDAIQLLAGVRLKRGEYEEAKTLLEAAVSRFPSNSDLRLRLGLVYKTLGETPKAREQLNLALQLDPAGNRADEIRRLLNSL
ncbi:MAG: tetratricopeptide repeat protein [Acidobacteria bacterium]|nr:tetratricopeptide repeat protein [Acidobacteriota bacterium]